MNIGKKANEILAKYRRDNEIKYQKKLQKLEKEMPQYFVKEKEKQQLGVLYIRQFVEDEAHDKTLEKIKVLEQDMEQILHKHGYSKKDLRKEYHCSDCKDEGHIMGEICHCKKQLEKQIRYHQSQFERRMEKENFDAFQLDLFDDKGEPSQRQMMEKFKNYLFQYAKNFDPHGISILINGPVGTGKTFLCSSIAKEVIDRGYSVLYKMASQIMKDLWDYYYAPFEEKETMRQRFQAILDADLLIIDDLGTESITDISTSHLFNLLNERIVQERPIIISTNLTLQDIKEYYDERIYSRIIGDYQIIQLKGEDLRRKKIGL